ncbi:MAG: sigma-70 family RNA polymerase sigma factor [Planctomycetes bacterium]|nr:sigma-70 family RNA polymerase sigma factor [Planctomycetota bacterium]
MSDEPDLRRLAERAAAGDEVAIEQLLELHMPSLRAFVRVRMGAPLRARESASDLVQSVVREVLTHRERFKHPSDGAFKHWLFTTAERKIANRLAYWGAQKRGGVEEAREPGLDGLLDAYKSVSSPSRRVARAEEIRRVEAAFDQLSAEHREVVALAHFVGLSRAEIGEQMGKTEEAVRALLFRAMARLSTLLAE